jgi:thiol-disulfide isomerase/thioredoxin
MTARRGKKSKPRRTARKGKKHTYTARGHQQSTMGKILPMIDVRSKSSIMELLKRINLGPVIIILLYTDWCGHCHEFMPHFDRAAKNPNCSVQTAKINNNILPEVKKAMKRYNQSAESFDNIEGFPSLFVLNNKGKNETMIEPIKDTSIMTKVVNELGNRSNSMTNNNVQLPSPTNEEMREPVQIIPSSNDMAMSIGSTKKRKTSIPKSVSMNTSGTPDFIADASMNSEDVVMNNANLGEEAGISSLPAVSVPKSISLNKKTNVQSTMPIVANMKQIEEEAEQLASLQSVKGPSIVTPASMKEDLEDDMNIVREPRSVKIGGSLYASLSQSAYTLATPAALLATAAIIMNRNTRKHGKRHVKHSRKHR